jgi:hypothetical protein
MLTRITKWFQRRKLARMPFYERTQYSFDGLVIRANDPLGENQTIRVADIQDLGIETTSLGPFVEDIFWVINQESEALRVPQCSPVFSELMKHFETLEGFDWESFNRSMCSTDDAFFHCWQHRPKIRACSEGARDFARED